MNGRLRPNSIRWFERLFAAALLLRLLNAYLSRANIRLQLEPLAQFWPRTALLALVAAGFLVPLVAAWLIARRANLIAAWFLAIWLCVDCAAFLVPLLRHRFVVGPITTIAFLVCAFNLASIATLTLRGSRRWLTKQRSAAEIAQDFA